MQHHLRFIQQRRHPARQVDLPAGGVERIAALDGFGELRAPAPRLERPEVGVDEVRVERLAERVRFRRRKLERLGRHHDRVVAHHPQVDRVGSRPGSAARVAAMGEQRERAGRKVSFAEFKRFLKPAFEILGD